jgi:hypothetical protein
MEKEGLNLTQVGRRFGLSAYGAGQWVRGYKAFAQAKEETECGQYLDENAYPYFQELFGRSSVAVREWMTWDDARFKFLSTANLNEFVSWLYPSDGDSETESSRKASWDRRYIGKRDDIRRLAFLITSSPTEWNAFRQDGDLEAAYSRASISKFEKESAAEKDFAQNLFLSVSKSADLLQNTPISILRNTEKKKQLFDLLDKLQEAVNFVRDPN